MTYQNLKLYPILIDLNGETLQAQVHYCCNVSPLLAKNYPRPLLQSPTHMTKITCYVEQRGNTTSGNEATTHTIVRETHET